MSPGDKNVESILNLLTTLHRARKNHYPKLSPEQQSLLIVTKEHVELTGLTIPTFISTLNKIGRKGYFFAVSIYEKKYHKLFKELNEPDAFEKLIKKLEQDKRNLLSKEDKRRLFEPLVKAMVPQKHIRDTEEVINEEVTYSDLFKDSYEVFSEHNEEKISYILLSPYRNLGRLLTKLEDGMSLREIKDLELWFDPLANTLYYYSGSLYLGKNIKKAKEALQELFSQDYPDTVMFHEIPESSGDPYDTKMQKAYYDSLLRVLRKDERLKDIFELSHDRLSIKSGYRDHAH